MAIFETDIKLLESQRLSDNPDGGGRLTGNEVIDGEANNLFPDISQLDRTTGRINLRKAYMAVLSPNTDTYYGSHIIITEPPADAYVHVALYDTGSWTDERADARARIESYVIQGTEWSGYLWGDHVEGQGTIRILQQLETELPTPNQTLVLIAEVDTAAERRQYVRVQEVEDAERQFFSGTTDYTRREVILTLSQPLAYDFPGHTASRTRSAGNPAYTTLHRTQVADAARYFGIRALEADGVDGELHVDIGSVMTPLVPATQAEEAITDQRGVGDVLLPVVSGGESLEVPDVAMTDRVDIELANRQQTYVHPLVPLPAPGTLRIDYRAQGQWYRITDAGSGTLSGDGAGQVDYDTGTVQASLLELPDVGTAILYTWGARGNQHADGAGESWAVVDPPAYTIDLDADAQPGTLAIDYVSGGTPYTITDDGEGTLTGDGSGTIRYREKHWPSTEETEARTVPARLHALFTNYPDPGSTIAISADAPSENTETFEPTPDGNGDVAVQLANPFLPGSLELTWRVEVSNEFVQRRTGGAGFTTLTNSTYLTHDAHDDGAGNIVRDGAVIGTVDNGTGAVSFTAIEDYTYTERSREWGVGAYETTENTETETLSGSIRVAYADDTPPGGGWEQSLVASELGVEVNLLGLNTQYTIVAGTLRFTWGGVTYGDSGGALVRDPDGEALPAGTIDYASGEAHITSPPASTDGSLTITRMVVTQGLISTDGAVFRTPGPQRAGSLIVQCTSVHGASLTAQAGTDNAITGDGITGYVDAESGIVEVVFPAQVMPGTIRFSTVAYSSIPLDADILGLDPVRLPSDGRVPMIRPGDVAVVHNTQTTDIGDGSTSTDLGRTRLSYCHVFDANGDRVPDADVIADLDAGTVEVDPATDSPAPFSAEHRIEDMLLVAETQITGHIAFARALSHDFPAGASYLSTAVLIGDRAARTYNLFAQTSWNGDWSDDLSGDSPTAAYNDVQNPITVTNEGAIEERWALHFTDQNRVNVIGEYTGQILTEVQIDAVIAPTNPATDVPYFTIPPEGWGGGWAAGNLVRFNTSAANYPLWIARTILAGEATSEDDRFRLQVRGDAS